MQYWRSLLCLYLDSFFTFSAIDFEEFLDMYKRLFVLCKSVVSKDVSELTRSSPRIVSDKQKSTKKFNSSKMVASTKVKKYRDGFYILPISFILLSYISSFIKVADHGGLDCGPSACRRVSSMQTKYA